MLSLAPLPKTPVPPTTFNLLPQELLLNIGKHIYQDMSVATRSQADSTINHLIDLQSLNNRWKNAFANPLSAAENAASIHQCPTGKKLAATIRELMDIDPELQASSWDAVASRLTGMNVRPTRNTVRQFMQLMPMQAPAPYSQISWQHKRDLHLARFAARVLPDAHDLMEDFLLKVIESSAPMDGLVDALHDVISSNLDSRRLATLLDEHVDNMPSYCRAGFEAARACMEHGGNPMGLPATLDVVNAAPDRARSRLLAKLGNRTPTVYPLNVDPGLHTQPLVDSIRGLPPRHRITALESIVATGWEPKRVAMLLECLPADPQKAAVHLQKFLAVFDSRRQLDAAHAFATLGPVLKHILATLRRHGVAPALQAIALLAPRFQGEDILRERLHRACIAYQKMLPPADGALIGLVANALLAVDGETRVDAFRLELQQLQKQAPEAVARVIEALCEPSRGIPSYVVMACLDTLKATMERIPPAQAARARTGLRRLIAGFEPADRAVAARRLAPHANAPDNLT